MWKWLLSVGEAVSILSASKWTPPDDLRRESHASYAHSSTTRQDGALAFTELLGADGPL